MEAKHKIKLAWAAALPEAWRSFSVAFRPWRMTGAAAISVVLCLLLLAFIAVTDKFSRGFSGHGAAYDVVFILTIYHLGILWLYFPAQAAASIAREWRDKTWVFQQTTPQGSLRLLLGKVIGAPADGYIALAASWPALLVCLILSPLSASEFLLAYAVAVLFGFAFSFMAFYFAIQVGQVSRKEQVFVIPVTILGMLFFPFAMVLEDLAKPNAPAVFSSIINLNPFTLFASVFTDKHFSVPFFSWDFPLFPAMAVFYAVWLGWFLIAASAQITQRMSRYSSRLPLVGLLVWLVFLVEGATAGIRGKNAVMQEGALVILTSILLFTLYVVMIVHSRPLGEIRPWLYHWKEKSGVLGYFFRTDSPVIFTFIVLQSVAIVFIAGDFMLRQLGVLAPGPAQNPLNDAREWNEALMLVSFFAVTLRDCLLIQFWRLYKDKKDWVLALIYFVAFIAVPGLFAAAANDWVIELTPLDVILVGSGAVKGGVAIASPVINLIIAAGLAVLTWRLIVKAYRGLPPELS